MGGPVPLPSGTRATLGQLSSKPDFIFLDTFVFRSVLYSSNCNFSRQAGAEVYVIVAVVGVVFLVAVVALAWSRTRRRTHTQVSFSIFSSTSCFSIFSSTSCFFLIFSSCNCFFNLFLYQLLLKAFYF